MTPIGLNARDFIVRSRRRAAKPGITKDDGLHGRRLRPSVDEIDSISNSRNGIVLAARRARGFQSPSALKSTLSP
jgi:hypothetical protein